MSADQKSKRGKCTGCGKQIQIRQDGLLRPHGHPARRCSGSHTKPGGDGLDWLLNHKSVFSEVVDHFWHLEDGEACDCEETGRV